jgi:hypothetical protein
VQVKHAHTHINTHKERCRWRRLIGGKVKKGQPWDPVSTSRVASCQSEALILLVKYHTIQAGAAFFQKAASVLVQLQHTSHHILTSRYTSAAYVAKVLEGYAGLTSGV